MDEIKTLLENVLSKTSDMKQTFIAVSYTHLTLPTILLV